METLPELLKKLDLDSADSLRKYTKKVLHEMVEVCKDGIQVLCQYVIHVRVIRLYLCCPFFWFCPLRFVADSAQNRSATDIGLIRID